MKRLILLTIGTLFVLVMASCGGGAPAATTPGGTTATELPTLESSPVTTDTTPAATAATGVATTAATAATSGTARATTAATAATTGTARATTAATTAATAATTGTSPATTPGAGTGDDIVAALTADGRFQTLLTALQAAGLNETLRGTGPYTLFAPTDEAFAALPANTLNNLLANPTQLSNVLLYHVVAGQELAADIITTNSLTTVEGSALQITTEGNTVRVNSATVITPDIQVGNGVIHVIDQVLLPPSQ